MKIVRNGIEYADNNVDIKDKIVTYESADEANPSAPADMPLMKSGSLVKNIIRSVSLATKNVRYLLKMLGTTDISTIGNGTVTGAIDALNTGIATAGKLSAARISHDAYTEVSSPRYVFRLGNVAFLRILTHKTIVNANTVLFTVPKGYRPKTTQTIYTNFVRQKDGLVTNPLITLNTDGTIVSNFNDDGDMWSVDLFYVYTVA